MAMRYVGTVGKKYRDYIRDYLLQRHQWYRSPHPLEFEMVVCPKDNRAQDLDNRIKTLLDAFKYGCLFKDDAQIERLEVRRGPVTKPGVVIVTVREILVDHGSNLAWIRRSP